MGFVPFVVGCLRASTGANEDRGGPLTAGFIGHWASDVKYGYMFALRQKVERAAFAIGQARLDLGPVQWPCAPDQFAYTLLVPLLLGLLPLPSAL